MSNIIAEFITCPKDKCPLDVLADMGKEVVGAWIFLHEDAVKKLAKSVDDDFYDDGYREMYWQETEKYPSAAIKLEELKKIKWNLIHMIDASDIAFKTIPEKPEKIFYIRMEGKE